MPLVWLLAQIMVPASLVKAIAWHVNTIQEVGVELVFHHLAVAPME